MGKAIWTMRMMDKERERKKKNMQIEERRDSDG